MPLVKLQRNKSSSSMDYLRTFATRSVSESRAGERRSTSPRSPSSPFSLPIPKGPNAAVSQTPHHHYHHSPALLPNTDPLPTSAAALEGLLNHHAAQLQKLADRVETVNEWIEMDGIVLARLVSDMRKDSEREDAENMDILGDLPTTTKAKSGQENIIPWRVNDSGNYRGVSGESGRVPLVQVEGRSSEGPRTPLTHVEGRVSSLERGVTTKEAAETNVGIREIRERIKTMKKWRMEMERTVVWQRDEYFRIKKVMGQKRDDGGEGRNPRTEEGWGVAGKKWEKGIGRLPTQTEWEVMFGTERLRWDEKGSHLK